VDIAQLDDVRQHADFVLRGEVDGRLADRRRKAEKLALVEAAGEREFSVAIDARAGDRLVVGDIRGPCGDRVLALGAFIEAHVDGFDRVEHFRAALGKQVRQAGSGAGANQGHAILGDEALVKAELLGLEGVVREVRIEVQVVRAQAQSRPQNDFIEDRGRGVDDQVGPAGGAYDGPEVPRVGLHDFDLALFAEEAGRALDIAIAAPDGMPLPLEELCQKGARAARSQNEDPHRIETLPYPPGRAMAGTGEGNTRVIPSRQSVLLTTRKAGAYDFCGTALSAGALSP